MSWCQSLIGTQRKMEKWLVRGCSDQGVCVGKIVHVSFNKLVFIHTYIFSDEFDLQHFGSFRWRLGKCGSRYKSV